MLGKAPGLGCSNNNITCLCTNMDFGNGVRDCTFESCPGDTDKAGIIKVGSSFCGGEPTTIRLLAPSLTPHTQMLSKLPVDNQALKPRPKPRRVGRPPQVVATQVVVLVPVGLVSSPQPIAQARPTPPLPPAQELLVDSVAWVAVEMAHLVVSLALLVAQAVPLAEPAHSPAVFPAQSYVSCLVSSLTFNFTDRGSRLVSLQPAPQPPVPSTLQHLPPAGPHPPLPAAQGSSKPRVLVSSVLPVLLLLSSCKIFTRSTASDLVNSLAALGFWHHNRNGKTKVQPSIPSFMSLTLVLRVHGA